MITSLNQSNRNYRSTPTQHKATNEHSHHFLHSLLSIAIEIIRTANMPLNFISLQNRVYQDALCIFQSILNTCIFTFHY